MTLDPESTVAVVSDLVNMPIPPEYRASVVENFTRIQTIAQLVTEFPLPDEIQVAPQFEP